MTLTEAVQILRDHNAYRRHDGPPCDPPHDGKTVGQAIDLVCDVAPELLRSARPFNEGGDIDISNPNYEDALEVLVIVNLGAVRAMAAAIAKAGAA